MANHKSAKKRIRQNIKLREANRKARTAVRTAIKKTQKLAAEGKKKEAQEAFLKAEEVIAKAGAKNLYHAKNASRKVSRLAKVVAQAS
jgi:small subunit ribosomal protein S20